MTNQYKIYDMSINEYLFKILSFVFISFHTWCLLIPIQRRHSKCIRMHEYLHERGIREPIHQVRFGCGNFMYNEMVMQCSNVLWFVRFVCNINPNLLHLKKNEMKGEKTKTSWHNKNIINISRKCREKPKRGRGNRIKLCFRKVHDAFKWNHWGNVQRLIVFLYMHSIRMQFGAVEQIAGRWAGMALCIGNIYIYEQWLVFYAPDAIDRVNGVKWSQVRPGSQAGIVGQTGASNAEAKQSRAERFKRIEEWIPFKFWT